MLAWYFASPFDCCEDTSGTDPCEIGDGVAMWRDRSGSGNHITQATAGSRPIFLPTGWNNNRPTVEFDGSDDQLTLTSGTLLSALAGTDAAFSVFCTVLGNIFDTDDQPIVAWEAAPGTSLSLCQTASPPSAASGMQYVRTDAAGNNGASNGTVGADLLTTSHIRLAYIFSGTAITTYVGSTLDLNAASSDVGSLTLDVFRMGATSGLPFFSGRISEIIIYSAAKSSTDWTNYLAYSAAVWGGS
jgi:hypothetical protein